MAEDLTNSTHDQLSREEESEQNYIPCKNFNGKISGFLKGSDLP